MSMVDCLRDMSSCDVFFYSVPFSVSEFELQLGYIADIRYIPLITHYCLHSDILYRYFGFYICHIEPIRIHRHLSNHLDPSCQPGMGGSKRDRWTRCWMLPSAVCGCVLVFVSVCVCVCICVVLYACACASVQPCCLLTRVHLYGSCIISVATLSIAVCPVWTLWQTKLDGRRHY